MKPLSILHLYGVRMRARFFPEAFAVIGIAAGVALLFASQVASSSLNGSVHQLTSGLVGQSRFQLAARDPHGFDQRLLGEVQRLPGVRAAAPVLEAQAVVIGPTGRQSVDFVGADPRFVHLGGRLLQHFSAAALARESAIALPAPVAAQIGAGSLLPVEIQLGASTQQVLMGIALQASDIGALIHSPVALAPLGYAQQLTGMTGRITRIFIQVAPRDKQQVRAALGRLASMNRLNLRPANFDSTLFDSAAAPTNQSTAIFAAISALVGFVFAYNALLLTVPARRRLITDLSLDGYGPWTIAEVLLFDALVLGVIASIVGVALGDEFSRHLIHTSPGYLSFAFPVGDQRIVTWQSIVLAVLGGLLAACVGVLAPLQGILSRPHAVSKRISRLVVSRGTFLAGIVCVTATTIIIVVAPQAAVAGVIALTMALLLLLPSLLRGVILFTRRATLDVKARAPSVAVDELRSTWAWTIGIAATGAIAVFGSVAIQGAHADQQRGLDGSARDVSATADVWAFPPGLANLLATTPFHAGAVGTLTRLPGVQAVRLYRGGFLDYAGRRVWVSAPPRSQQELVPSHQLVRGNLALANRRVREGGWAIISQAIAAEHHLRIGQPFSLPSPRPMTFRVAALSTNIGWPPGSIVINADDYARAWESNDASAYQIIMVPGASAGLVRGEVIRALGPTSGLTVQTSSQREQHQRTASRQGLSRLTQISLLVLVAAVLAMAAAMGNMIFQRRPRLLGLKLDGFPTGAVWRTLMLESLLLLGSGCSIGAIFGLYGQLLGSHAILTVTGFPVVAQLGVLVAFASFGLVTLGAVAIVAAPGYLAARGRPEASISD
jgi:putative ABC transport system permease protein